MRHLFKFKQVMKYLYSGGCSELDIPEGDVLEVLAAASFFQLVPLQRHCEARAAKAVDLHNLVSVYIHAKVQLYHSTIIFILTFFLSKYKITCVNIPRVKCCWFNVIMINFFLRFYTLYIFWAAILSNIEILIFTSIFETYLKRCC